MKGEKARAVETQGAAKVLAVSDAYQGEAGFLSATQQLSAPAPGLLRREAAAAWVACGAFERAAFAYFGASSVLIALFAEHLRHPLRLLGVRAIVVCVVLFALQDSGAVSGAQPRRRVVDCGAVVAFLAALVSAFVFPVLF